MPKKNKDSKPKKLRNLVIVESPSKAATIKKYLGGDFEIKASVGHLIDLPKSKMGVDLETFDPQYIVMRDKSKILKELREDAKNSKAIYLASDPDREGEAIAWHIKNDFEKNVFPKIGRIIPIKRVKFNEITENEIKEKINFPEEIEQKLVDAQQGRRVIDRIFGYKLSPLLWKKVKSKLSAGRVQSATLRLICEREEEIENFKPEEYWEIFVDYDYKGSKFVATLSKVNGKKPDIKSKEEAEKIKDEIINIPSIVKDVKKKNVSRQPYPPFITSSLQQAANTLFGFSSMKTMQIAQQLYEGINLGNVRTGLITYMRTDSTRISEIALNGVRKYISEEIGENYLPEKPNYYANKTASQDAHEAIRPTNVKYHPDQIEKYLTPEQYKLYSLIWKRFVASQMKPSVSEQFTIEVECGNKILTATTSKVIFDGFLKVYDVSKSQKEKSLPENIEKGVALKVLKINCEQKFTEPPPRYTEASLVKEMEELGIGRPSTYAPTIYTLTKRYYVKKEKKTLIPTELGRAVNKLLVEYFPEMITTSFTSKMEEKLDYVEEGKVDWKSVVKEFYDQFLPVLNHAYENMENIKGSFDEMTDFKCEKCGKPMVKKFGKYGEFLACSGWPECKNAKPFPVGKCPKCKEGNIIKKKGKKRTFYGCDRYPDCDFVAFSLADLKKADFSN
ncbi:MAG: type I DNA topoisomerase [Brevinematales bacterium]|nr:type I DNA topoisomerase [Brevinematales bacterium]